MPYIKTSVPKPPAGSGAPKPKNPNVTIIDAEDVLTWPLRDSSGVLLQGNFVMREGASMIQVYMTHDKQDASFDPEGEFDAEGFLQKFMGTHPGDSQAILEYVQNWNGRDIIIIADDCSGGHRMVFGTQCSPLRLKGSFKADKDGTTTTLSFEQIVRTRFVPALYNGDITLAAPFDVTDSTAIALATANGLQYRLAEDDTGEAIAIASSDLAHGDVVSLIGSGGTDPSVLSNGPSVGATVMLVNGTSWTALQNAVLNLRVFEDGATTFLYEVSRS